MQELNKSNWSQDQLECFNALKENMNAAAGQTFDEIVVADYADYVANVGYADYGFAKDYLAALATNEEDVLTYLMHSKDVAEILVRAHAHAGENGKDMAEYDDVAMEICDKIPVTVDVICGCCGETEPVTATLTQFCKIAAGNGLIQDVAPDMTPAQRELFISRTCGKCWNAMFGMVENANGDDTQEGD